MKRLFRWLFRLLILSIVLLVALVLLKDTLLKALVEWRIRKSTGLTVTINKLEAGLLAPTITMEGFKLYNPPEFGGSVLVDVPQAFTEYDWNALAGRKVRLRLLRFSLAELNVVKSKDGRTNIPAVLGSGGATGTNQSASASGLGVGFGGIDRLYYSVSAVKYTDMAQPRNNWQRQAGWKDVEEQNLRTSQDVNNWLASAAVRIVVGAPPTNAAPVPPFRAPATR